MARHGRQVAIMGAGPTGASLAIGLGSRGASNPSVIDLPGARRASGAKIRFQF